MPDLGRLDCRHTPASQSLVQSTRKAIQKTLLLADRQCIDNHGDEMLGRGVGVIAPLFQDRPELVLDHRGDVVHGREIARPRPAAVQSEIAPQTVFVTASCRPL